MIGISPSFDDVQRLRELADEPTLPLVEDKARLIRIALFLQNMYENTAYMPVPRCDGCRHWKAHPPNAYSRPVGDCQAVGIWNERGKVPLGTADDFGCVRWEAK